MGKDRAEGSPTFKLNPEVADDLASAIRNRSKRPSAGTIAKVFLAVGGLAYWRYGRPKEDLENLAGVFTSRLMEAADRGTIASIEINLNSLMGDRIARAVSKRLVTPKAKSIPYRHIDRAPFPIHAISEKPLRWEELKELRLRKQIEFSEDGKNKEFYTLVGENKSMDSPSYIPRVHSKPPEIS